MKQRSKGQQDRRRNHKNKVDKNIRDKGWGRSNRSVAGRLEEEKNRNKKQFCFEE